MKKVLGMILAVALSITSVMLGFSWLKFDNDKTILKDAREFLINNNYISEV